MLLVAVYLLVTNLSHKPLPHSPKPIIESPATSQERSPAENTRKVGDSPSINRTVTVADIAALIRQYAAQGGPHNELYRQIANLQPQQQGWWRRAEEVSSLLDLASDSSLAEQYRVLALGIYLAAAPQTQLNENSAAIQQLASGGSDDMVSAVLQGMADRSIAPSSLTKATLASEVRGTGAKCYAWYAARLTQKNDAELAGFALARQEALMTEATKVGFDYLASGSFQGQYAADPRLRQGVEMSMLRVKSLEPDAGPMDLANGDAFIRSIPSVLPADAAAESLLSLLRGTPHPEMRLSAIEQLVSIHLSGGQDLSQELHAVRNDIATLFSDPVKQTRAKKRLNRAALTKGE
jgi:hypothetical protein